MAAKIKTSITLSQDALMQVDQLVMAARAQTRENASVSSVIEALIHEAYAKRADHLKRIEPVYELIGKRKKLIGFDAWYGDDLIDTRDTHAAAQAALDTYVYEELSK